MSHKMNKLLLILPVLYVNYGQTIAFSVQVRRWDNTLSPSFNYLGSLNERKEPVEEPSIPGLPTEDLPEQPAGRRAGEASPNNQRGGFFDFFKLFYSSPTGGETSEREVSEISDSVASPDSISTFAAASLGNDDQTKTGVSPTRSYLEEIGNAWNDITANLSASNAASINTMFSSTNNPSNVTTPFDDWWSKDDYSFEAEKKVAEAGNAASRGPPERNDTDSMMDAEMMGKSSAQKNSRNRLIDAEILENVEPSNKIDDIGEPTLANDIVDKFTGFGFLEKAAPDSDGNPPPFPIPASLMDEENLSSSTTADESLSAQQEASSMDTGDDIPSDDETPVPAEEFLAEEQIPVTDPKLDQESSTSVDEKSPESVDSMSDTSEVSSPSGALSTNTEPRTVGSAEESALERDGIPSWAVHDTNKERTFWGGTAPVTVQGGSLRTWSFVSHAVNRVQVALRTEGRPLNADIHLWQGPDNTPQKMRVYLDDGSKRTFSAVFETPGSPNTIAIRNTGQMTFPMDAYVTADIGSSGTTPSTNGLGPSAGQSTIKDGAGIIQGGALRIYPFGYSVESVQVLLQTDGRPLNARIELLQGPNNIKQAMELYIEDGKLRPFYAIIETPGSGNTVRIVNTGTVEFPMTAWVAPYLVDSEVSNMAPVISGGNDVVMLDQLW